MIRSRHANRTRIFRLSAATDSARMALALLLFVSIPMLHVLPARAQSPPTPDRQPTPAQGIQGKLGQLSPSSVSAGMIEKKIEEIATDTDLDEAASAGLTELYRKALSSLEAAKSYEATAANYAQALEAAPQETEEIRLQLETAAPEPDIDPLPTELSIKEIEQLLAKERAETAAVEAKLAEMEKELEDWSRRPTQTRDRIIEAKGELEELDAEIDRPVPAEESPLFAEANGWALQTRQRELRAEILMLDQELLSFAAREALLSARRDKAALDLKILRARQRYLDEQLDLRRSAEAEQARLEAEAAKREATGKHPLLENLAEKNRILTDELSELTTALDGIDDQLAEVVETTKRISDEFRNARQRLEIAGLTQSLGQVLIDRRQKLPNRRAYRREARKREQLIAEATLRQISYDEDLLRLRDLETFVDELTVDLEEPVSAELRDGLRELAQQRRSLLDKTTTADDAYLRALGELDYASSQLMLTVERYDDYLSERLLWVRSAPPVSPATLNALPAAIGWLLSPGNWLQVAQVLLYEATTSPVMWLFTLTALLLLLWSHSMRTAVLATAEPLRRVRTDHIRYSLQAIGLSALLAAPWPLLLVTLGWRLEASLEATEFTKAIGQGALNVAFGLFSLRAFRLLCIQGGVADRHFHWSSQSLQTFRLNFDWAIWFLVPLGFVAATAYRHEQLIYASSLGRVALLVLMVGFALFAARLLNPKKGVISRLLAANPEGWINRLSPLWYPFIVGMPLALAVLALFGYVYTAGTLLRSLVSELWLVLGLTVIHQVMVRWLALARRRLALQTAVERQTARDQEAQQTEAGRPRSPLEVEESEVDLATLDVRTRTLVNSLVFAAAVVGLWGIYSDVLPALAVFEDVSLWSYTGVLDGQERLVPVTLADIGSTLLIVIIAVVAAKNLPALLEILLLQRISLSSGSRYAVKTLTGYFIVAAASLMVFSTLGLSWSQVQWLVAALGVGIGFGLQEIVANFISGLILLFERPIRVGDIVTIGDITGVVSKIRIRATTIRNWDKQELLVPNKELITGRLLNWSLSDQMNRIVITVGVDYGADIPLALELLRKAAKENERVLEDPEPLITFEGFGDNALTLVLRCYLDSLENRLSTISELHQNINEKFKTAGISIAFPQRDVHLSTAEPLDIRVHQDRSQAQKPSGEGDA